MPIPPPARRGRARPDGTEAGNQARLTEQRRIEPSPTLDGNRIEQELRSCPPNRSVRRAAWQRPGRSPDLRDVTRVVLIGTIGSVVVERNHPCQGRSALGVLSRFAETRPTKECVGIQANEPPAKDPSDCRTAEASNTE